MMKAIYEAPAVTLIPLSAEDVLCLSLEVSGIGDLVEF